MEKYRKILLVIPRMNLGGGESHVALVARTLKKQGHHVEIASGGGALASQLAEEGIRHHWLPVKWAHDFCVWRLKKIVQKGHYDLIHAHSNGAGALVALVSEATQVPWIYTAHTGLRPPYIELFGQAKRILAVSEFAKNIVLKAGASFLDPTRVLTLHNAIDCEWFSPQNKREEVRRNWGVAPEEYVVGIVARALKPERKGHLDLIKVLTRPEAQKWKLVIVGKVHWWYGGSRKVAELGKKLGVSDRIIWSGHQLDVRLSIEGCDVVALPSLSESFGLALAEAMSMEKAVVAYDGSGTNEVIGDDEGGILVPRTDIEALGNALIRLENEDLRTSQGIKGRQRIKRLYDLPLFMEKLNKIYDDVLNETH